MKKLSLFAAALALTMSAAAQQQTEGALPGKFYVGNDKYVVFAKGNLQYTTEGTHACADSTTQKGTWRIADNQYDFIGDDNANISETYNGYIDLFGWGTSGWSDGITCYQPWSTNLSNSNYYAGGDGNNNLTGAFAFADWGVYNAISNAGNEPQLWRTLSAKENTYLFVHNKWTMATVGDVLGFMLFPSSFAAPEGINIKYVWNADGKEAPTEFGEADYAGNEYTKEQFAELEKAGVVFFPCAKYRLEGTSIVPLNTLGMYWSTTQDYAEDYTWALGLGIGLESANPCSFGDRAFGRSVRLVQEVENTAINNTTAARKARKVVVDGQVYIIKDGKMFTVLGTSK
ncbi:MAG: hypothetical protein SOY26_05585 [Paludibacteraceae bacterium]|nr:hypothetical protein [Bacteroidales bacterium]MDY4149198.1 hypothetical protein [Paludibacteraceae bacterium]